jgi:PBSX family phage terminase large subunit
MADSIVYNTKLFNPLFWHLLPLLSDSKIRYIYIEGGSSASKTYSIAQAILDYTMVNHINTMVFRSVGAHIKDSIYESFKNAATGMQLERYLQFLDFRIKYQYGDCRLRFRGLDDEEGIKGIEGFDIVYNNEWNQFFKRQWDQQRKRLRGKPNQKFICDWNPVNSQLWLYKEWIDLDTWIDLPLDVKDAPTKYSSLNADYAFKRINKAGDSVWIKVTHRDNFWVVGHPSGKGGFYDEHVLAEFERDRILNPNDYRVYANGERGIMKNGSEVFKQFKDLIHVRPVKPISGAIHLSLDENVNPYVTVGVWQIQNAKQLTQVHELPCKTPENNAPKAAKKTAQWLRSINHEDLIFVYGDPSASRRSTVDPNSASFYDKFIEVLTMEGFKVINRVAKSAPETGLAYAFINDIYEHQLYGWSIVIGDNCVESINDYSIVQEDKEGKMLKPKIKDKLTGITYEPHGHFSDQKKYFICRILNAEFTQYKAKRKKIFGY